VVVVLVFGRLWNDDDLQIHTAVVVAVVVVVECGHLWNDDVQIHTLTASVAEWLV